MCGIASVFAYHRGAPPVEREELMRMRDSMAARGPDGEGLWVSDPGEIGLAHRRLSIIDLTDTAHQPMAIADGRYRIIFNGEIYNYQALRRDLEGEGCRFHSTSDTEVLLQLYAKRGPNMVHALRGMFAFTIWDKARRGLFLARDPFGIKPLYMHDDGKTFRCASQVKALLAGGGIGKEVEPAGHVGFFLWGSVPEPYTLYRDIFAMPAGHTLWVDENGPRAPQAFFDVADALAHAAEESTQEPVANALQAALRDSLRHHLIADVPVGAFLSSGVDSGTLVALASEQTPHINAITLGFKEYAGSKQDETPLAKELALRYGCKHHIEQITKRDFEQELPRIFGAMDQPSTDGVNTYFVARAAAHAGLKVALSGLGGDELLGGYPGFRQIPKLLSTARIPAVLPGFGKGFRWFSAPLLKRMTSPKYAGIFEYGGSYGGAYLLRRSLFMPWELPEILDPDLVREGWETLQPVIRMDDEIAVLPTSHAKISALELTHYMRNTLLRDSDWAGMAHSLEIRTPLVDIGLFRALAPYLVAGDSLPGKQAMAQTPANPLPDNIVHRPKTGFSVPVGNWVEAVGEKGRRQRGLRGWAMHVYSSFEGPVYRKQDRRKRILALVSDVFGSNGGIAKFNRDLLTAASASPAVSSVVAMMRTQIESAKNLPIKIHYDTRGIGRDCRCLSGKINYLREFRHVLYDYKKIDLVICGIIGMVPIAYLIARIKRAPFCFIIHGVDAWQPDHSRLVNRLIGRASAVLAVSEYTKKQFIEWSGMDSDKVLILPNCYDPMCYGPGLRPKYLLERYGLQGKTIVMTLGRLAANEQYKGFDEIMERLPTLAKQIPDIAYLIVGNGDDKQRLQTKAEKLGIADRVVFTGYIPEQEKADHYRLADAYVMPGRGEGFGIVYLEAMACGIPTVASKLDGSRDALRDGQLGILADPNDLRDVQKAVLNALKKERGKIPEGLDYFSIGNYRRRTWRVLSDLFVSKGEKR